VAKRGEFELSGRLYWRSVSHLNTFRDSLLCGGDAPAPPAPEIVIRIVIRALDQSLFIERARFYRRSVSQRTEIAANCTLPGLELVHMILQEDSFCAKPHSAHNTFP
jgi:hypothetical protein